MAPQPGEYDLFLSHAWADGERPQQIADALTQAGLRVWFDAAEINDFASITRAVTEGLAKSKALLAYYSKTYPLRRACQWELTAAFLAAQTEGDPRRRVLVINPENSADHIHPVELRDERFFNAPNNNGDLQKLVQSIVRHVAAIDDLLPDIHPLNPPPWHGTKPVRYERFVGRFQEMWKIHSVLNETRVVQITGATGQDIAQVTGLGGIGKSLLAREYALRFGPAYPGGIFWLRAYGNNGARAALSVEERDAERNDQLHKFAQDFEIQPLEKQPDKILRALSREMGRRGQPCLWIVDDLPAGLDAEAFQLWCGPHPIARTLVTTRSRTYANLGSTSILSLEVLPEDDAYQLLTSRRKPAGGDEEAQARGLANDLGCHALALDVTASALVTYGGAEPYRQFREELKTQQDDALDLAKDLADALPTGHEPSIAQTMLRSIRNLGAEGLDFLRLASVLAVAPISAALVTSVFDWVDSVDLTFYANLRALGVPSEGGNAERRQRKAFHDVYDASLAEIAGESQDARLVHTLVSRVMRFQEKPSPERTQALRRTAIDSLREEIAKAAEDPRLHSQIEAYVVHARQVVPAPETVPEADLASWIARYDYERGYYASARSLFSKGYETYLKLLGPVSATLESASNLALALREEGNLAEARRIQEEVLGVSLAYRSQSPEALIRMDNLAHTLHEQGDLAGARQLQEQALAAWRRMLGTEHRDTLTCASNLAQTMREQGELAQARKLHEETLEIRRRVLGPDHLETLQSMLNLSGTLLDQGDLMGASKLQEEELAVCQRSLPRDHPLTLTSMNNMAYLLFRQGDLPKARKLAEEVLETRRSKNGPKHPDVSISAWALFSILYAGGERAVAEAVLERDLVWLLDRDPDSLSGDLRKIRDMVDGALDDGLLW